MIILNFILKLNWRGLPVFCQEKTLILLSGLQVQLYEDFAKSRAKCDIDETVSSISLNEETEKPKLKSTGHVFQVQIFSVIFIT